MKTFELEIWPNPKKIRTLYFSIALVTILAWLCFAVANFFWTPEYTYYVKLNTVTSIAGWPVKLYWWGLFMGTAGAIGFCLVYLLHDKKNPLLALNNKGLFIRRQMTLVEWPRVRQIIKVRNEGWTTMEIYLKEGKRLKFDNRFTLGDFDDFAEKAKDYIDLKI